MKTVVIFFIGFAFSAHTQNQASQCYFGTVGIDFRTSPPTVDDNNSAMQGSESPATMCDENGNLLFYTNGGNSPSSPSTEGGIWNKNHVLMENGDLLDSAGCFSSLNGAVITPFPDDGTGSNDGLYYLFTRDCLESNNTFNSGLTYCVIDMNQNGGLGKVIEKYQTVIPNGNNGSSQIYHEPLAATQHSNGNDYWLFSYTNNELYRLAINSSGINGFTSFGPNIGVITISPAGNFLVSGERLFEFNNTTGDLTFSFNCNALAAAFSPDGTKLYTREGLTMYQYQLDAPNISSTKTYVADMNTYHRFFLAADGRIYFHYSFASELRGYIECPNNNVNDIGYALTPLSLGNGQAGIAFTNVMAHLLYNPISCNVGIDELNNSEIALKVFPNPSVGLYTLSCDEKINSLEVYQVDGKLVERQSYFLGDAELDLSKYESGTYILNITTDRGVISKKIFKK